MSDSKTVFLTLPCLLTDAEREARRIQATGAALEYDRVEAEKKEALKGFGDAMKALRQTISQASAAAVTGEEEREVECVVTPDLTRCEMVTIRSDTAEVVKREEMTNEQRRRYLQTALPVEDAEQEATPETEREPIVVYPTEKEPGELAAKEPRALPAALQPLPNEQDGRVTTLRAEPREAKPRICYTIGYRGGARKFNGSGVFAQNALFTFLKAEGCILLDIRFSRTGSELWRDKARSDAAAKHFLLNDSLSALGNRNYNNGGAIDIVDLEKGLECIERCFERGWTPALLCACEHYEGCHRQVIAEELMRRGWEVREITKWEPLRWEEKRLPDPPSESLVKTFFAAQEIAEESDEVPEDAPYHIGERILAQQNGKLFAGVVTDIKSENGKAQYCIEADTLQTSKLVPWWLPADSLTPERKAVAI